MKQATGHELQLGKWIGGAALGALVMYMLDPDRGAPRRALSGDKLRRLGRQTGAAFEQVLHRDAPRRFAGLGGKLRQGAQSLRHALSAQPRTGQLFQGRPDSGPDSGPDSRPDSTARPAGEAGARSDGRYHNAWGRQSPDEPAHGAPERGRGTTLAGASVLGLAGLMAPRSPIGIAMGLAGLALLVRATGKRPLRMHAGGTDARHVVLEQSIRIDAPPEQVFDLFAKVDNFPRFMSNVIDVRDLGEHRSHWVLKGPAGTEFTWNAVLTEYSRPRRLAWESEPGADVQQSGAIEFEALDGATRVTVRMSYRPPAGAAGHAFASLLGRDPARQMDEDLARLKWLVERGAMAQGGSSSRQGASGSKFLH